MPARRCCFCGGPIDVRSPQGNYYCATVSCPNGLPPFSGSIYQLDPAWAVHPTKEEEELGPE